jgi:hypothetical protein
MIILKTLDGEYAMIEPYPELAFQVNWYLDTVNELHIDNSSVYGLHVFEDSCEFFQGYSALETQLGEELLEKLEQDQAVVFDGELNIPDECYIRVDAAQLVVTHRQIHWIAYGKHCGTRYETICIHKDSLKEFGLEHKNGS